MSARCIAVLALMFVCAINCVPMLKRRRNTGRNAYRAKDSPPSFEAASSSSSSAGHNASQPQLVLADGILTTTYSPASFPAASSSSSPAGSSTCTDDVGFRTTSGFTCVHYEARGWCTEGGTGVNWDPTWEWHTDETGKTAQEACCGCGKTPARYIGCYADTRDRDLPKYMGAGFGRDSCASKCKSMRKRYASLQDRRDCFCGNTYGKHGATTGCDCDNTRIGAWKNCVYSIEECRNGWDAQKKQCNPGAHDNTLSADYMDYIYNIMVEE